MKSLATVGCAALLLAGTAWGAPDGKNAFVGEINFDELDVIPQGGLIEQKDAIPSKPIAVVNSQKDFVFTNYEEVVTDARHLTQLPLRTNVAKAKAPASIEFVARDCPSRLVLFPEEFHAEINMRALMADGAKPAVVEDRVRKELVRAAFFLMGSGSVNYCLTRPIRSLKDLDKLPFDQPAAETVVHLNSMSRLGIHMIRFASYRTACKAGWAPPPDNAERQAIWDEYHTKPTKPIEIKFDPKVGK